MRSRSTYLLIAVLLILAGGIFWQRGQRGHEQGQRQQRQTSFAVADPAVVDQITIRYASTTTELAKQSGAWRVAGTANVAAENSAVDSLVQGLAQLAVLSVAARADADLTPLNLSQGRRTELTIAGSGKILQHFFLGQPPSSYGTAYLLPADGREVYLVQSVPSDIFTRTDWRDKAIVRLPVEDIQEIKYQRGRLKFTLAKIDGAWQLDGKPANQDAGNLFAANLAHLNAVEFLPSDTEFKPLGITVGLTLKDRQIELTLGAAPQPDEAYLKTSDGKMYLLANTNRTRLTKERKEFVP